MPHFHFPKTLHLRKTSEFDKVYQFRCSASDATLIVYIHPNGTERTRLGMSVSRKIGRAVTRNRWKRLIREAFRLNRHKLPFGMDIIVLPQRGISAPKYEVLALSLRNVVWRAFGRLKRSQKPLQITQITPSGRSAVAVLHLEGGNAPGYLKKFIGFLPKPVNKPQFARFRLSSGHYEEIIINRQSHESVEIHCHGGEAVIAAIRATLNVPSAVSSSESLNALSLAKTERVARILLDQYNGALERELSAIEMLAKTDPAAEKRRQALQETAKYGKRLVDPFRIIIAGLTNAGKSSLINAMLGFDRAIVDSAPGTTRDVVEATIVIDGFPFLISDTAGIRESNDFIEQAGIAKTIEQMDNADLTLWVSDLHTCAAGVNPLVPPTGANTLIVHNKCDLPTGQWQYQPPPGEILVSAREKIGIDVLLTAILTHFIPNPPKPGDAVIITDDPSI